ncbi:MAG: sulfotransferase family protein [Paraglaciecola sp.]|nr:sulfotransferase family protein [Paraglaciecola sp.]
MKNSLVKFLPTSWYLNLRWYDFKLSKKYTFNKLQNLRLQDDLIKGGYLPFDKARAIFVHIPKCAGISVNKALFGSIAGGHTTLDQYINIFSPTEFKSYFKFTFVRNPWDRVVSAYFFLKKGGMNKYDAAFYQDELAKYDSFKHFVMDWLKPHNLHKHHHFAPQLHYIIDKHKKVTVDYICYFENIEEDFNYIAHRMGVDAYLTISNNVEREHYSEFYDDETIKVVANIYQDDIRLLNYQFEGCSALIRKINL